MFQMPAFRLSTALRIFAPAASHACAIGHKCPKGAAVITAINFMFDAKIYHFTGSYHSYVLPSAKYKFLALHLPFQCRKN